MTLAYGSVVKKLKVAFDCDDTLLIEDAHGQVVPNHNIIDLLRWFTRNGHDVIVWSGGGVEYAQHWVDKFGLKDVRVIAKASIRADIAIDDLGYGLVRDSHGAANAESGAKLGTVVIHV